MSDAELRRGQRRARMPAGQAPEPHLDRRLAARLLLVSAGFVLSCSTSKLTPGAAGPTALRSAPALVSSVRPPVHERGISWRYEVNVEAGRELAVEATFEGNDGALHAPDEVARFVRKVEVAGGSGWASVAEAGGSWPAPCKAGCRVRYRFALGEAADAAQEPETALAAGDVLIAPASTWLLHPEASTDDSQLELHVEPGPHGHFLTAFHAAPDGHANTYRAATSALDDAGFAAFGGLQVAEVPAGDTTVLLGVAPHKLGLTEAQAKAWVAASAGAVANYYRGHLPARRTLLLLTQGSGRNTHGETLSGGGPAIVVRASELVNANTTSTDWVVTHELFHANFPDVGPQHAWLSEGLATYLEPIARARVGLVSEPTYWRDLIDGLPQGLPAAGDQGLEHTRTWGRTYWGGALFCLMADVTLRERTGNRYSLDDVLLAIGKTGATDETSWNIQQVLDVGDRATNTRVLHELYEALAQKPGTVDLSGLFGRLGVRARGGTVVFDDSAPLAKIRRSITAVTTD